MKKNILLSILLTGIFVATSAYIIIVAQGTRIDGKGNIVSTSIIRINSIPDDVVAYVNDQKATLNENRIEWLEPGEVKLTLKKAGYRTWERTVSLKAGLVEDIYAQLSAERLNFEKLSSVNVDQIFFSDNTDFIFYTVINGEDANDNGVWRLKLSRNIFDIGEIRPSKVYSFENEELDNLKESSYKLYIANDNSRLILDNLSEKKIYLLDINNSGELVDVTNNLNFYPTRYQWYDGSNSLIVSNGNILLQYEISSAQSTLIYLSKEEIKYDVSGNLAYFYRNEKGEIYRYQAKISSPVRMPAQFTYPELVDSISSAKDNQQIIFIRNNDTVTFVDLEKDFVTNLKNVNEILQIASNGKGIIYKYSEELFTGVMKDTPDLKSYTYSSFPIDLNLSIVKTIIYSPSGKIIMALTEDAEQKKTVWMMDYDGFNQIKLVENEDISGNKINISNNNSDLYLILKDSSDSIDDSKVANVYKFDLEGE